MKKIIATIIFSALTTVTIAQTERNEKMLERFLRYVRIDSQDMKDAKEGTFPILEGQKEIAQLIFEEINAVDGVEASISPDYYVYAKIPANTKKKCPSVLFMAHSDVTNEAPGGNIKPQVHRNYAGGDIRLKDNVVISPDSSQGRHLKDVIGKTIVTSDGTTLLGADDKTGCAVIVTAIEEIVKDKKLKHGDLYFCISQNEDLGLAAERMDISYLGGKTPDLVYDIDGGNYGEFSRSNFTGLQATYHFRGISAHPSYAYGTDLTDALSAASIFIASLPIEVHPLNSKGMSGYMQAYIFNIVDRDTVIGEKDYKNGDILVTVRVRYFDKQDSVRYADILDQAKNNVKKSWPRIIIRENLEVLYDNIAFSMHPATVSTIEKAAENVGIEMHPIDLRAGTTASMMVAKGLRGGPCIYSGQQAEHSKYEWCCIEEMLQVVELVKAIAVEAARKTN